MAGKICDICGQPSGLYPLCKNHLKQKEEGLVIKNLRTNRWEPAPCTYLNEKDYVIKWQNSTNNKYSGTHAVRKNYETKIEKCIICDNETQNNNIFCKDCYAKVKKERMKFDHNRKSKQISDHYYSLKDSLQNSTNKNEFCEISILMWALAEEYWIIHNNIYLRDRVKLDIYDELRKRNFENENKLETNKTLNDEDFRNKWPREYRCSDGHYVRSKSESIIDNWLYNNGYLHAYEKLVFMETEPYANVLSDFYIPKGNVYIEFWGIENDEKYTERKNQKFKLYDENNINRIDLYEKDISRIDDILPRLLAKFIK